MNPQMITALTGLAQKIATELVFTEPGKDLGLLPINSLIGDIENLLEKEPGLEPVKAGAQIAKQWVLGIFDTSGSFSGKDLKWLGQWTDWWPKVVSACGEGSAPPPPPAEWLETRPSAGGEKTLSSNPASSATEIPTSSTPAPESGPSPAPEETAVESGPQEEPSLVLNLADDRELLTEFINESKEHLQNIEQGVLDLEDHPDNSETLDSIFRAFHTFKGGSGFLNLTAIQTVAHELESLLDKARQQKLAITPPVIDVILEGGDTLKKFVGEIASRLGGANVDSPILVPTLKLIARIRAVLSGKIASIAPAAPRPAEGAAPASSDQAKGSASANIAGTTVKVDTLKLDSLIDLVGEMVIAQSLVTQNNDLRDVRSEQLTRDLAHLGRITRDLQRTAMSLRMVAIGGTFHKMHRLVRDITTKLGKHVELVTSGEDTELDRTIVEEISDPLVHMIRNSIDHGIEKPEIRKEKGKPETGTITLKAYHQGGAIVIEIADDGRGLDRERILAKGIEKGLVRAGETLDDSQIFGLILEAGFSTAEKVTDLSGRGVGMDVVRRNIEKLRGKLEIQSVAGKGTTFSIHLPLTLAIIDGLLVGIGQQRFIVPTLLVRESFRPAAEMISTVHGRGEMVNVRGRLCPLLRLYEHLGVAPESTDPTQAIILVVEAGSKSRCVMVDRLIGKQEVVIKSLGEIFRRNRHTAGAAILGDGGVGLILDPEALVNLQSSHMEAAA
jgi:two-component system chemotaxis sensor kinase CheA